jgi:hypothetical protein
MSVHLRRTGMVLALLATSLLGTLFWGKVVGVGAQVTEGERPVTVTITPFRLVDTRPAPIGPIGGPATPFGPDETRTYTAWGAGGGAIPADATGIVLNITAVNATADSFLTLWPAGTARPLASTLNPFPGRITFNAAVVDLNAAGQFSVFNKNGRVDVIIDVTGYLVDHLHDDQYYTPDYVDYWTPIGFGFVGANGSMVSGTLEPTASTYTNGYYMIDFGEGYTYSETEYVTNVTLSNAPAGVTASTRSQNDKLVVELRNAAGELVPGAFQFVTFWP